MAPKLTAHAALLLLITSTLFLGCNQQSNQAEQSIAIAVANQSNNAMLMAEHEGPVNVTEYFLKVFQGDIGDEQLRLFLDANDQQFVLERIKNKPSGVTKRAALYGTWQQAKKNIRLEFATSGNRYTLIPKGNNWQMQSVPDASDNNKPRDNILFQYRPDLIEFPDAPMQVEGMYFYADNIATFEDCHTGKKTAVELSPILNKKYHSILDKQKNRWVYLQMRANFALLPTTARQIMQKHLVLNGTDVVFNAVKQCADVTTAQP